MIQERVVDLHERLKTFDFEKVVSYYPPEMEAERERFGIAVSGLDGTLWQVGDYDYPFPLHSISKVFTYCLALADNGREETLRRVGVEPSGNLYNSFTFDERNNRPFNPMVNSGALVAANLVHGANKEERVDRILENMRLYAGNPDLKVHQATFDAQMHRYNDRNMGLSYLMRSLGMLEGDIEDNIAVYLSACSVHVTATDLAIMGTTMATGGVNPLTEQRVVSAADVRDVMTVMTTCGMYDAAGEWAYDVGIPAKSGVSGGILYVLPISGGGGIFSPGLDVHGNSARGIEVCRALSETFSLHMFSDPSSIELAMFALADTDGNGTLTLKEFITMQRAFGHDQAASERAFERLDKDGNGTLTIDEVQQAAQQFLAADDSARGNRLFGRSPAQTRESATSVTS